MEGTIIIVDEIAQVAAATNTALQSAGFAQPVYYLYGHPIEVNQRLQELTDSPTEGDKKFPLIWLFTDITIDRSIIGFYGQVKLRLLIANLTEAEYTAKQRTEQNFKPILHPIKEEFLKQLFLHKQFTDRAELSFKETDMYFYGTQYNDKNILNDKIDAIEIKDLIVNIKSPIC